jgi:transcriptional regulator with XRE-family HTH domain
MAHNIPKLLEKMMEALPGNQTQLAARLTVPGKNGTKITQPQISRWIRGQDPERASYERIVAFAKQLGVITDVRSEDVASALITKPAARQVKVKGYVGAGAVAHYYALADEDFEEVEGPVGSTDQTIAVEIKGTSFGPLMESWLVFYDDIHSPITESLIGKVCVVGLADDRILIKKIIRNRDGGFDLLSNSNEEPIKDAEIEWAAKVTDMRPR